MKKEVKISLAAIAAIILLFIGINFLKGINVFQSSNTYYVKFADIGGLSVSNPVFANGYPVGIVRTIDYDYQQGRHVVVGIELDKEMNVPEGTRAELETELMGGVKMLLALGPNPLKHIAPGDTIHGGMKIGAMDKVGAMIPVIEKMLPKLDSILTNVNHLTGDGALEQTLHNTAALTAELHETSVRLNGMMKNDLPQTLSNLKAASANANVFAAKLAALDLASTLQSVDETLASARKMSDNLNDITGNLDTKLKSKDNTLGLFLNDRGVYDNLNSTLQHADSLMIDLKAHPKRYVHFSIFGKKDK